MPIPSVILSTRDGVMHCPRCRGTRAGALNPALVAAVDAGLYRGPVVGGVQLCADCDEAITREEAARGRGLTHAVPLGLPKEFERATFKTWTASPGTASAVVKARQWLRAVLDAKPHAESDPASRDLYLTGATGTGKSRLAATLLNMCHAAGCSTAFVRVPMALERVRQNRHAEAFELYASVAVLALDDLGADKGTDAASESARATLGVIADLRGDEALPTIWTSNLSLTGLAEHYHDERLASRIAGRAVIAVLEGADQRRSKKRAKSDDKGGEE